MYEIFGHFHGIKWNYILCAYPHYCWILTCMHLFIAICISHLWSICLQFCSDYLLGYLSFFVLICRARWSVRCGECGSQKNKKSHLVFGLRQKWTPRGHLAQEHWGDSEQTGLLTTWLDGGLGSNLRAAAISSSPHIQGDLALGGTLGSEGPRTAAWVTIIHKYPIATECPPYTRHRPRQWTQQWMDRWEPCSWWVYVLIRGRQSRTDAEAEAPILWPPDAKGQLIRKDPDAGKDWSQEEKGMTEDEMVRWHHLLNGHEFEQTLQEMVRDRETWQAVVHKVIKSRTWLCDLTTTGQIKGKHKCINEQR